MKYVVAVSGGVDSVVLLDMLFREGKHELIVAHFEHGIRGEDSKNDADFVQLLSQKYRLKCEIGYGNLTSNAPEAEAREKRYKFLKNVAKKHDGRIVTAHHQDDLIETIALNLHRGTGWRGLAVFGNTAIERPLLAMAKAEIYDYALSQELEWVEDVTNQSDKYLRNRLRKKLGDVPERSKQLLLELYQQQLALKHEINQEVEKFEQLRSRYFFTMLNQATAREILRQVTIGRLTRPQLDQLHYGIKTAAPGTKTHCSGDMIARFSPREFIVETPDGMV